MAKHLNSKGRTAPKRALRLPDPDLAKRAVLTSLGSPDSTRACAYAIDDFIAWYCSEPRLAFGKHVVLRYRIDSSGARNSRRHSSTVSQLPNRTPSFLAPFARWMPAASAVGGHERENAHLFTF